MFKLVSRILRDLSISTSICLSSDKAFELLERGTTDLLVIDWQGQDSADLLKIVWGLRKCKKPTVLAVSEMDCAMPGVHVIVKKPLTVESTKSSFKTAYLRMLIDHRRHTRYSLMIPATAATENGRTLALTVLDIGDGGVGISTKDEVSNGDVISFRLQLPGTQRGILIQARVLWTREFGRFGCEFMRIPPADLIILHDWLRARQQIKKPLNPL